MIAVYVFAAMMGRQQIDLNAGWEFSRLPAAPSVWSGPDAVLTSGWRVSAVSSEEVAAERAGAQKAFDGDPKSFWHSEWSKRQAPFPHALAIDLGSATEAVGIRILPRQTGPQNGRPKSVRVFLDSTLVVAAEMPDSSELFQARFARAKGRILRVEFLSGHRNEPFLAIAEIGLIRPARQGSDWSSQYDIARVDTGEARFDPGPSEIEQIRKQELGRLLDWRPTTLPHAGWVRPLNSPEIWQGVLYYRRRLPAPPPGRRAILTLQGMQSVDVWLNGRLFASRRGGYLPLRTPIREGGNLLVRVDNRDNPLIPPGKPQGQLDFMYGNGLIGNASMLVAEPLHISDPMDAGGGIVISPPRLATSRATFSVRTNIRNDGSVARLFLVRQTVFDPSGRQVADRKMPVSLQAGAAVSLTQEIAIQQPALWSPDSPKLYRLRTTLEERGRTVDAVDTNFGLRTIDVSRAKGFLLNGKPLRLVGTNRHQDYPWIGPALSDAAQWRDAVLIKRSGHNIVRLSHYNQSPAFLDACDRLGILTIPCIPGWQFINKDRRFHDRVLRDVRETVRRDRNHPSVAFWEVSLNETYASGSLAREWHDAAKSEGANLTAGDEGKDVPWDVTYNGWREDLSRPSNSDRPGYIREYGDYEFGGANSSSRVRIGAGMSKLLEETWNHVWSYNRFRPQYPTTIGAGTWEMFDHNVPWDFAVSSSGLADLMRREKPSFWFYASQEAKQPYARIAADWASGPSLRKVIVFSNAEKASLYLNGRLIATSQTIRGPETGYSLEKAFDGANTGNLSHPPIVLRDVAFAPGTLTVVGSNGARDTIRTSGKPARLKVWLDDLGVAPTTNDLVFVRAAVVDANGTICTGESRRVTFSGAQFAGENRCSCEMGVASALVRTPLKLSTVLVRASAGGLTGACRFVVSSDAPKIDSEAGLAPPKDRAVRSERRRDRPRKT